MLKFQFRLPAVGSEPVLNRTCPRCQHPRGHRHAASGRQLQDARQTQSCQVRMKCSRCDKTWTCYPPGIKPFKRRSDRTVAAGLMLYVYGLSFRYASATLEALGMRVHFTQIYRDLQEAEDKAEALRRFRRQQRPLRIRHLGIDGTGQRLKGRPPMPVLFASDLDTHHVVEVEAVSEEDVEELKAMAGAWRQLFGVEAFMTDGHLNYDFLDNYPVWGVRHLQCQAHFVKAKVIRARELRDECHRRRYRQMERIAQQLDVLLHDRSPPQIPVSRDLYEQTKPYKQAYTTARRRLRRRPRHYSPGYRLYRLATDIMEQFPDLIRQEITTNNATERGIGLSLKIRSKLMRGFVKPENVLRFSRFVAFARSEGPRFDLAAVV